MDTLVDRNGLVEIRYAVESFNKKARALLKKGVKSRQELVTLDASSMLFERLLAAWKVARDVT